MDAASLNRVRFLVRADAWAAWEALLPSPPADALDMALAEYGDLRLVAAYVLETVCGDARTRDAQAEETTGERTKSYEAVGEWKEEFFAPGESADSVQAGLWCSRAAQLRGDVEAERRAARSAQSVSLSIRTGF